jgi:ribosome-associated translation inhibitor RaiA
MMQLKAALDIAFECMSNELKKYTFDSNLYTRGVKTIATERANKHYVAIVQAMQRLEELKHQGRLFG